MRNLNAKDNEGKKITPPLCGACGRELTVIDKGGEGLLDDGGIAMRMANILSSAEHNNVMLTGEAGTGKSASVRMLGRGVAENKIPELSGMRIFEVNMDLLFNNCYTIAEKGEKLRILFGEAAEHNIILFIDEGHRICGSGESNSVGNIVKPYITGGDIRLILATTNVEYEAFIAGDAALARRFERIRLKEPDAERTAKILRCVFASRYPDMTITDETIRELIALSGRYIREKRYNPDKSLAVLDYAAAWTRNNKTKEKAEDENKKRKITLDDVKNALSEKLGIAPERFEQNLAECLRLLPEKLKVAYPAWKESIDKLGEALGEALTRDLRGTGPLCQAALSGCDMALLHDVAFEAARVMGFSKDEVTRVLPSTLTGGFVEPFLVNPNRAIIVELPKDREYENSETFAHLSLVFNEGRIALPHGDAYYGKAPIFVLMECEEEKNGMIGFGNGRQQSHVSKQLTSSQRFWFEQWFGGAAPIFFGSVGKEAARGLFNKRFLPLLEKRIKQLGAPHLTLDGSAREYVIERLAEPTGWSSAAKITERLIGRAMLGGGKEYVATTERGTLSLLEAASCDYSGEEHNMLREIA